MPRFSDISTDFLVENQMNYTKQVFPMRVVLIADSGEMFTLWLPETMEGRYRFTDSVGAEVFPFYFEHTDNQWVASLYDGAFFFRGKKNGATERTGTQQVLSSMSAYRIQYKNEKFVLYVEEEHPGDHVFLPYYVEERTDYTIGRIAGNDIIYPNPGVSRDHARIHWNGASWSIIDLDSTNGTFVNGKKITNESLRVGDIIFIVGLYIIVGVGYLSINNLNNRVQINTPRIRPVTSERDLQFKTPSLTSDPYKIFDRIPRKIIKVNPDEIEIESPPMPMSSGSVPFLLRMGTPALMGGSALMNGNILMAMTSMVMPALTQGFTEKDRKEYEKKRLIKYREYLEFLRTEIQQEKIFEEKQLNLNYPNLNNALKYAQSKQRLWEHRKTDEDFLSVRLGYGNIPMIAQKVFQKQKFQMERDVLEDEMYQLAEAKEILNNVPIMHSFRDDFITGISGTHHLTRQLVKNIILQLVSSHSYDEVKIVLIADADDAKYFDFVRYLPHNWDNLKENRFFIRTQSDAQKFTNLINTEYDELFKSGTSKRYNIKKGASYVVFALSKNLYNHIETFKNFLDKDEYFGMSIVAAFEGLPKECTKVINVDATNRVVDYFHPEVEDVAFKFDSCDDSIVRMSTRTIMSTKLNIEGSDFMLPNMVTFLEMFNAGRVEHLNPLNRWAENNPVKSLAAPVGVGTDGKLFDLDLHEKHQGPHGLVAGMTGSGKSEFLITYILSMAVNYSPDEVAFVLIDYKGGGLADAFEDPNRGIHLPHLVGTITNLDGSAVFRSMMSIKSELKRRQAIFKKAKSATNEGTMDIYDYQKLYRSKKVSEPLPHLFIISDEFAEMKSQQPEFMDELISTARIGRSLGVHLILATQKPSGVVNDQIRSNTKFQVCLRVQDRSDSMDMIKRPDAAELKHTGRFYLQVGYNEYFAQGQSAWCGAEYAPQDEVVEVKDYAVRFVDSVGQQIHKVEPETKQEKTGQKQIVSIVKYLSDLAVRENIKPKRLWVDPLPKSLDLDALAQQCSCDNQGLQVPLGMIDDPEHQDQFPFVLNLLSFNHMLIYGTSGSGKSTLIKSMILGAAERFSPEVINFYIIDLSAGSLNVLKKLPHCGAYLTENDEADIDRLFTYIHSLIEQRKELFAQADVTNYSSYLEIDNLPLISVIVDGLANMKSLRCKTDYYSFMSDYVREASNYGVMFVLSTNGLNDVTQKTKQEVDYKITLSAKDRFTYSDMLNAKVRSVPTNVKGRGILLHDGTPLEYHVAMPYPHDTEQTRNGKLRERVANIGAQFASAKKAVGLPTIRNDETYSEFCEGFDKGCLPMGYLVEDVRKISLPLKQFYHLSAYFGNPLGTKPVLENLIEFGKYNQMNFLIIRRQSGTVFDSVYEKDTFSTYSGEVTFINTSEEGLVELDEFLVADIIKRNAYRDEYCAEHGIPASDKGRVLRAARYIKEHTTPLLVIFESYGDFCRLEKDDDMVTEMSALLSHTKGYNIYFTACFYPNETGALGNNALMKCFNEDELCMFFGGQYDKQSVLTNFPMDLRKFTKINPNYDRYLLKYRGEFYTMHMPCGEIQQDNGDPDEASII